MARKILYGLLSFLFGSLVIGSTISILLKLNDNVSIFIMIICGVISLISGLKLAEWVNIKEKGGRSLIKEELERVTNTGKLSLLFFFGNLVLWTLWPTVLLTFDKNLIQYLILHIIVSIFLISFNLYTYFFKSDLSSIHKFSLSLLLIYAFFLTASWPFSILALLLSTGLFLVGFIIPMINLKLTYKLYTLGGSPLHPDQKWLETAIHSPITSTENELKYKYLSFLNTKFIISLGLLSGALGLFLAGQDENYFQTFLRFGSLFMMFGLGLTFGTNLKKIKFQSSLLIKN